MCSGPIDSSSSERASEDGMDGMAAQKPLPGRETFQGGKRQNLRALFIPFFPSQLNFTIQ